jgi:hypothetical protein
MHKQGDPVPPKWKIWFQTDKAHTSRWREEAKAAFAFAAGRHWSETDKAKLREEMRPAITFDRASVIVDAISGNEIQNRQEVQYLPREMGDALPNEIYTEAARWFDDEAEAENEDSEAFVDSLWCGMGFTETRLDFDEDPEGMPAVDRVDPMEMYWDSASAKANLRDARRMWRLRKFTRDEIMERWPDIDMKDVDAASWAEVDSKDPRGTHSNDPEDRYDGNSDDGDDDGGYVENQLGKERKTYCVAHLQYWEYEPFYKVADPTSGQIVDMADEDYQRLSKHLKTAGLQLKAVKLRKRKFYQAFLGRVVLEHGPAPCEERFNWAAITGKRDRQYGYWYGLYRALKDPQEWANKWMSQVLHILNSNAKGGLMYEEGAFVNQAEAEENWAKPNGLVQMRPGALTAGKVKERGMAQFPQGFHVLTEFAIHAIRDVTGVNLELLGQREATQAGVLEYQRRQAGMTVLAPLFDSLKRYRKNRGRVMLYYIINHLSDGRLIRITGDDKQQYVPLVRQSDAKYDIIVDAAPTSPNQKEMVWQSLMAILPGVKDMIPPDVLLQLMDYSPLPTSVVQKIKDVVKAKGPEQEKKAKLAARAAIAEIAVQEADAQLKQAQAQKAIADAGRGPDVTIEGQEAPEMPMPGETEEAFASAMDKMASAELKKAQTVKTYAEVEMMPAEMDLQRQQAKQRAQAAKRPALN